MEEEFERSVGVSVPMVVSLWWLSRLDLKSEVIDLMDPERFREAFSLSLSFSFSPIFSPLSCLASPDLLSGLEVLFSEYLFLPSSFPTDRCRPRLRLLSSSSDLCVFLAAAECVIIASLLSPDFTPRPFPLPLL